MLNWRVALPLTRVVAISRYPRWRAAASAGEYQQTWMGINKVNQWCQHCYGCAVSRVSRLQSVERKDRMQVTTSIATDDIINAFKGPTQVTK